MRQQASDLVRRVEGGEVISVMVSGRPAIKLVPAERRSWRKFSDVVGVFNGPSGPEWQRDRDLVDGSPADP